MGSLKDMILAEAQNNGLLIPNNSDNINPNPSNKNKSEGIQSLLIKNKLDKLFYLRDHLDEDRAGLHASAMIASDNDFCYRQQVLSLLYKQNQGELLPVNLMRIFAQGNAIHEKWQNLFVKAGIADMIEGRSFSEEYELYFTPDAVIILDGKKYVVEIKSMNTFSFQKANSHPSGHKQMQLYMHLLGIPQGFVLAEDKNSQDWKPFLAEYDPEVVKPILARLNTVQEMKQAFLKYKEMPPRKCKKCDSKRAKECGMRDACFNVGIGRIRFNMRESA
jgi:hypothetical protein